MSVTPISFCPIPPLPQINVIKISPLKKANGKSRKKME
jgi:hypothetical protein